MIEFTFDAAFDNAFGQVGDLFHSAEEWDSCDSEEARDELSWDNNQAEENFCNSSESPEVH